MTSRLAIVTGGSRGVGAATARRLAHDGWNVLLTYRTDASAAAEVVADCRSAGAWASAVQVDVADETQVDALFAELPPEGGPLRALVNNAGIVAPTSPPLAPGEPRLSVTHALAVCACITLDDAPTWLLYVTADGGFGWTRDPDADEALDLVDARFAAVEHAAPSDVLAWLQGSTRGTFGDGGPELRAVLDALAQVTTAGR